MFFLQRVRRDTTEEYNDPASARPRSITDILTQHDQGTFTLVGVMLDKIRNKHYHEITTMLVS